MSKNRYRPPPSPSPLETAVVSAEEIVLDDGEEPGAQEPSEPDSFDPRIGAVEGARHVGTEGFRTGFRTAPIEGAAHSLPDGFHRG